MTDIAINVDAIVLQPVADLMADPRNVKKHPENQLRQIMASINRFGFNDPIAVDQDNVVVEGHGRLEAAQRLGMNEVPTLRLTFASETERRAYAIAHNQTQQLSPLDNDVIMDEFDRLGVTQNDYEPMGFTNEDVVFMSYERGDLGPESADEEMGGEGDEEHDRPSGPGFRAPAVVRTLLKFDTQEQLFVWYGLLDWLRTAYPNAMTLAERLDLFIADYAPEITAND